MFLSTVSPCLGAATRVRWRPCRWCRTRMVTNYEQGASRKVMYKQIGWMTVNQLSFYHSALTTFRIRQSQETEYLNNILNRNKIWKVFTSEELCSGTVHLTEFELIQESVNLSLNWRLESSRMFLSKKIVFDQPFFLGRILFYPNLKKSNSMVAVLVSRSVSKSQDPGI